MTTGGVVYEELKAENERLKKLLGQCMERQANPPVMLEALDQEYLDRECNVAIEFAHSIYRKIFWKLYWKKDFGI